MRGKKANNRKLAPDHKYSSELVSKLINYVMYDGKKNAAREIVYKAMSDLEAKTKSTAMEALEKALENVKPRVEIRSKRVGGANLQVPVPVSPERQVSLALRWIIDAMRKSRGSKESWQALSTQLHAAFNNEGDAVRKREDVQRMAESNRAYAQLS
ncbi:MAG: 30S ribosomal protein S7 [Candidatus Doudnabacteria bacterium]|nr:30S ribosomal protein S7 [Candidatus Doudnabacteria bacterium]